MGGSNDPLRVHNEAVLSRLFSVVAKSGATPEDSSRCADREAARAGASCSRGQPVPPPATSLAASELAAAAQEQRSSVQHLVDGLQTELAAAAARDRLLREQLQGLRSKLQYHGSQAEVRHEICDELSSLAATGCAEGEGQPMGTLPRSAMSLAASSPRPHRRSIRS